MAYLWFVLIVVAPHVLITDGASGQARSTLAAARALAHAGYAPVVTVSGSNSLAAASRYCARAVTVPPAGEPGYAEAVGVELASDDYVCVLPSSDAALLALGFDVGHLLDKSRLLQHARRVGIPVPAQTRFELWEELVASADDLDYPLIVKPVVMGPSVVVAQGPEDLRRAGMPFEGPVLAQEWLGPPLTSAAGVVWEGRLVASVHQRYLRTWPPAAGGACAAVSVERDVATDAAVTELLGGFSGLFHAQFAAGRLIDLNPRLYGSLPLAVKAGVNVPAIYCDLVLGRRTEAPKHGRPGVYYRSLEGELRWAAHHLFGRGRSPLRAVRALVPHRRVAHAVESLTDPGPMLARLRHVVGQGRHRRDRRSG
ncbi:MAG: hypothetical protein ACRDJV_02990 [Actinomycetota bacterium]